MSSHIIFLHTGDIYVLMSLDIHSKINVWLRYWNSYTWKWAYDYILNIALLLGPTWFSTILWSWLSYRLCCGFIDLIQVHKKLLMYSTFDFMIWHFNKKIKRYWHRKYSLNKDTQKPLSELIEWLFQPAKSDQQAQTHSVLCNIFLYLSYILTISQCLPVLTKRKSQNTVYIYIKKMHFFLAHISRQSYSS